MWGQSLPFRIDEDQSHILFILYPTARLHCVCLLRFTMLYSFIGCEEIRANAVFSLSWIPRSLQYILVNCDIFHNNWGV